MKTLIRSLVLLVVLLMPVGLGGCTGEAEPGGPDEEVPFDEMDRDTIDVDAPAVDTLEVDTMAAETTDVNTPGS